MTRKKNSNRVNNNEINDQVILPFGELADLMPDAAIILDASMQIVYLNSNAVDLFGYSTFEAVGQKLDIFLPDEVIISHSAHAAQFLIEETTSRRMGENRLVHGKHRDGRIIPLDISITQRSWNNQLYVICVPRDISHQIAIHPVDHITRNQSLLFGRAILRNGHNLCIEHWAVKQRVK